MKNVCLSALVIFVLSLQARATELVSVLKTEDSTPATATATDTASTTSVATPVACKCHKEEFRAVTLSPRHVRRLNRVADRQEARNACRCGCKCDSTNALVESDKNGCCCR